MSKRRGSHRSQVRNAGASLLYSYPITGKQTFKPSGDPVSDPPEVPRDSVDDQMRRWSRLDTPEGRDAWDAHIDPTGRSRRENAYYEAIRFNPSKPGKGKG